MQGRRNKIKKTVALFHLQSQTTISLITNDVPIQKHQNQPITEQGGYKSKINT